MTTNEKQNAAFITDIPSRLRKYHRSCTDPVWGKHFSRKTNPFPTGEEYQNKVKVPKTNPFAPGEIEEKELDAGSSPA